MILWKFEGWKINWTAIAMIILRFWLITAISIDDENNIEIDSKPDYKILRSPQMKKDTIFYNGKNYENVDTDHVYLLFNDEFTKWSDGEKVVEVVAQLLKLSPDVFSHVRVGRAEVTFKVSGDRYNEAKDIAEKIGNVSSFFFPFSSIFLIKMTKINKEMKKIDTVNKEICQF